MRQFIDSQFLLKDYKLDPRDAFYDGKTGNVETYYSVKDGEIIQYYDFRSMYPKICASGKFSVGYPTIYVNTKCLELTGKNYETFTESWSLARICAAKSQPPAAVYEGKSFCLLFAEPAQRPPSRVNVVAP